MLTDHERVLADLKVHLQSKDSHGRRELLTTIGELEAKHQVDEGVLERAFRVRGNKLSADLLRDGREPDAVGAAGANGNGS
jgi:hypothetical protein